MRSKISAIKHTLKSQVEEVLVHELRDANSASMSAVMMPFSIMLQAQEVRRQD